MADPKLFVSYSWTSADHQERVLRLATELRQYGVDVMLDKWDLREGHDAYAFMEKMVTDPEIKKVLLVCDKVYAEKADGRNGGVGTETQIITGEIYSKQDQDKFVAVITERDEHGKPYLPTYYRSRVYVDLSDPASYSENFERLLRWLYDQPLDIKPELGQKPAFLENEVGRLMLATTPRCKRALDAIRENRDHALPASVEFFNTLVSEFEKLRIMDFADPVDDKVVHSIDSFLTYRNEVISLFLGLALYRDSQEMRTTLHRFFESLIPFLTRPDNVTIWHDADVDNFKFLIHELFLYAIACLLRYDRFDSAAYLMSTDYYVPQNSRYDRDTMVSFQVFRNPTKSLDHRNKRLGLRRLSLRADLLEQRCRGLEIEFRHLMQADFVLFLRSHIDAPRAFRYWWPETLLYVAGHDTGPFEIFARCRSRKYFDRVKVLLGIGNKEALQPTLDSFDTDQARLPRWDWETFNPRYLLGFDNIGTNP